MIYPVDSIISLWTTGTCSLLIIVQRQYVRWLSRAAGSHCCHYTFIVCLLSSAASSCSVLVLVTDSLASCLHFIRLFWNHTLTWLSDKPSIAASWCLSAFVKYFCTWKRFSSPFRCKLENTARVQGLLGRRDRACPWIDWVHISDEVDGCLLLQLLKGSNKRNTDYFMESARVRFTHEFLTYQSENERVSFMIQKHRERKYGTKHLPYCNLCILYLLRFSPSNRFLPFIRQSKFLTCIKKTLKLLNKSKGRYHLY